MVFLFLLKKSLKMWYFIEECVKIHICERLHFDMLYRKEFLWQIE